MKLFSWIVCRRSVPFILCNNRNSCTVFCILKKQFLKSSFSKSLLWPTDMQLALPSVYLLWYTREGQVSVWFVRQSPWGLMESCLRAIKDRSGGYNSRLLMHQKSFQPFDIFTTPGWIKMAKRYPGLRDTFNCNRWHLNNSQTCDVMNSNRFTTKVWHTPRPKSFQHTMAFLINIRFTIFCF